MILDHVVGVNFYVLFSKYDDSTSLQVGLIFESITPDQISMVWVFLDKGYK